MRRLVLGALAAAALGGCFGNIEPLPLDISISASPTAPTAGSTVTISVEAQGQNLVQIELVYGDGSNETQLTGNARTAQLTRPHVYAAAGTYQAVATVTEASGAQQSASVEIVVQ